MNLKAQPTGKADGISPGPRAGETELRHLKSTSGAGGNQGRIPLPSDAGSIQVVNGMADDHAVGEGNLLRSLLDYALPPSCAWK